MTSDDRQTASLVPYEGRRSTGSVEDFPNIADSTRSFTSDAWRSSDLIEERPEYRSHPARLDIRQARA